MATIKSGITVEGTEKIAAKFNQFVKDTRSAAVPIMRASAIMLQEAAKKKAPVSKSGKRSGKYRHPPGALRDAVAVGQVYRTKAGISAAVGIKRNQYFTRENNWWYARWVEFGTKARTVKNWWGRKGKAHSTGVMPEQPFMRIAVRTERAKIRRYVRARLKEELFRGGLD